MAGRKQRLKAAGFFLAGFVSGAVLAGGLVAWRYFQMFKSQHYNGILSNTHSAYMIRAEQEEELLQNLEANMQQSVVSAESLWGTDEDRLPAFWFVQRYYQKFQIDVPDDIRRILAELPVDPRQQRHAASTLISVGDKAPDFTCTTLNGQTISLGELQGRVVLIYFFATWCGPCVREMPYLQSEVFEKFGTDDFFMIAIAREQQVSEVTEFRNAKGFTFPMAADPDKRIYGLFATEFIPRTFVIDKNGVVKWESAGLARPQFQDLVSLIGKELE
jgi:peroxiredoxin